MNGIGMHVNMPHRLSGDFTVRLHKAQSVRLQRLVHRASQLCHGCAHGSETLRRHLEHGCKMGLGDHQTMPFVGWMDVHESHSRPVPIEFMTLRGSGDDLAENALRRGHGALPVKAIDRQSIALLRCVGLARYLVVRPCRGVALSVGLVIARPLLGSCLFSCWVPPALRASVAGVSANSASVAPITIIIMDLIMVSSWAFWGRRSQPVISAGKPRYRALTCRAAWPRA